MPAKRAARTSQRSASRSRPPPQSSLVPLISRQPETSEQYLVRLAGLISDRRAHVYFDASFLMWLAKLGRPARAQFLRWVAQEGESRFHVPLWAAHEFIKHQSEGTILKDFGTEIGTFDRAAVRLYENIRSFCCDELFGFANGSEIFLDEFRRSMQPLRAMLAIAKRNSSAEIAANLDEMALFIDKRVLPGPLESIIEGIEAEERTRNRGVIPPGFQDAHKRARSAETHGETPRGDNSFGDLLFWRETVNHAAKVSAKWLIVATGDRKNDWFVNFHGDRSVSPEMRKLASAIRPVPMPQPLLLREAADRKAGELVLMDPLYCGALLHRTGDQFADFWKAAFGSQLPHVVNKQIEGTVWAARFGGVASSVSATAPAAAGTGRVVAPSTVEDAESDAVTVAMDDAVVLAGPDDCLPATSSFLDEYRKADIQKRAILLQELDWAALAAWPPPDLAVLGDAILREAEGGDPAASAFINDLRDQIALIEPGVSLPVYAGALRAIYFETDLTTRRTSGSSEVSAVLDLVTLPLLGPAAAAVGEMISGSGGAIFIPGGGDAPIDVEVLVQRSADTKSPADLVAIKVRGRNLTTDVQDVESLRFDRLLQSNTQFHDFMLGSLIDVSARFHRLPKQLLRIDKKLDDLVRVAEFAGVELEF